MTDSEHAVVDALIRVVKRNQLRHSSCVLAVLVGCVVMVWMLVERRVDRDFWMLLHEIRQVQDAVESTRCTCRPLSDGAATVGAVIRNKRLDEPNGSR